MKTKILIYVFLISAILFPQTKYLIYFKDKGIPLSKALAQNTAVYQSVINSLSAKCIQRREKVMGKNIITYEDVPIKEDYIKAIENQGIKIQNKLNWFNAVSAYLTAPELNIISSFPFVQKIEQVKELNIANPNSLEKIFPEQIKDISADTLYGQSFQEFNLSDIPQVHAKGITGKGVIIGILDDGFKWREHESLVNQNVLSEYNYVFHVTSTEPQPGDIIESGDHGTYVFSLIGGYKPGKIIGVAYNAQFILAKTEDDRSESHIEEDNYAAALEWMEGLGVDITTSSLGYSIFDDTTYSYSYKDMDGKTTICAKAVELAFQRGVITVSAAGNDGDNSWYYIETPGDGTHILTIGAVDSNNNLASFSSRGPTYDGRIKPDVVAMGLNNYGADVASGFSSYGIGSGTSYATPISAGVAALLLSAYPKLTNIQVRNIIRETAGNASNPNNNIGFGLISAEKSIGYPIFYFDSVSNRFILNKIFFSNNGIKSNSAILHYALNFSTFNSANLTYDDTLKYSYQFPQISSGDSIQFYFTYNDSLNNSFREPSAGDFSYNLSNGNVNIINDTISNTVPKYTLGNSYPNPFYPFSSSGQSAKIPFYSSSVKPAKLTIYNSLGQIVRILFNGNASQGNTIVSWNGKSMSGKFCSSGVYFYVLTLGSQSFSNKLVLLK